MRSFVAVAALAALGASAAVHAQTATSTPASSAAWVFDLRVRHESVDDDAFAREADASTARARIGWRSAAHSGWNMYAEVEATQSLSGDSFNSTANGRTTYPVIADPDNVELNQLYANYQPDSNLRMTLGRQRLLYDNQRFFGAVGWRQNEQTFDAVDAQYRLDSGVTFRYSYLDRVQRVFGNDNPNRNLARWDLDAHLLSAAISAGPGSLTAYAHLIDNQTLPLTSQRNLGLRYTAKGGAADALGWLAAFEFAQQDDFADGAAIIDARYWLVEGGLVWRGYTGKLGWERLGGDGRYGFQTPFATGHAFAGWADKFLTTPVNGLDDAYVSIAGPLARSGWAAKANWTVVWHQFSANRGDADYGSEVDASLAFPIATGLSGLVKLADYRADSFARDTLKLWLQVEYKH